MSNPNTNSPPARGFGNDLTTGSIPRHLLKLAVPMLLANLMSTAYSVIDTIWVGRFVGKDAIGAIAVGFPVTFIFIGVAAGATMATAILVAQFFGAKNYEMVTKTVNTSFGISIIMSLVAAAVGTFTVENILHILGTPEPVFPHALSYLKIVFLGFPILYMTFLVTSILRGVGDTKTPLYFMAVGVFINAVLDPFLIIGIGPFPKLGLAGAAWATLISSICGLTLGLIYLRRKKSALVTSLNIFAIDKHIVKLIIKIGFPSMIQQSAIALGMATITSLVNSFGAAAIAAFGAAGRLDTVSFLPVQSIGLAVSSISGQNIGAKRYDRIRDIFKWSLVMTLSISLFFSALFLSIPGLLLSPFTTDPEVIKIGISYLRIAGPAITFFAVMFVSNGVINGAGHTMTTLVFTLIAVWGIRVPLAAVLSRGSLGIIGVWLSYAIGFGIMMCVSLLWYRSGRWKKPVVRHHIEA